MPNIFEDFVNTIEPLDKDTTKADDALYWLELYRSMSISDTPIIKEAISRWDRKLRDLLG